jgi:hypothetical protein
MSLRRIEANTYEVEVLKPLCRLDVMSSILRPDLPQCRAIFGQVSCSQVKLARQTATEDCSL